jgi:hypothetical protein
VPEELARRLADLQRARGPAALEVVHHDHEPAPPSPRHLPDEAPELVAHVLHRAESRRRPRLVDEVRGALSDREQLRPDREDEQQHHHDRAVARAERVHHVRR